MDIQECIDILGGDFNQDIYFSTPDGIVTADGSVSEFLDDAISAKRSEDIEESREHIESVVTNLRQLKMYISAYAKPNISKIKRTETIFNRTLNLEESKNYTARDALSKINIGDFISFRCTDGSRSLYKIEYD